MLRTGFAGTNHLASGLTMQLRKRVQMKKQVILCLARSRLGRRCSDDPIRRHESLHFNYRSLCCRRQYDVILHGLTNISTGVIFFPIAMALADLAGGPYQTDLYNWMVGIGDWRFRQWYYLVPHLLEKPDLTLLNLNAQSRRRQRGIGTRRPRLRRPRVDHLRLSEFAPEAAKPVRSFDG